MPKENDWYRISNEDEVFSPALMVYPERIESNIRKMIQRRAVCTTEAACENT